MLISFLSVAAARTTGDLSLACLGQIQVIKAKRIRLNSSQSSSVVMKIVHPFLAGVERSSFGYQTETHLPSGEYKFRRASGNKILNSKSHMYTEYNVSWTHGYEEVFSRKYEA